MSPAAYIYRATGNYLDPLAGGATVPLGAATLVARPDLAFDMPTRGALAASPRKVWAHWMGGAFAMSIDNKDPATDSTEYWRRLWQPPGGLEGTTNHGAYGGLVRQRKKWTTRAAGAYTVPDRVTEINQARNAGFDGYTAEMLQVPQTGTIPLTAGSSPQRWGQLLELLDAADLVADPTFTVTLMPDASASGTTNATTLSDAIHAIAARRVTKIAGQLLIVPYGPELAPANAATNSLQFWTDVQTALRAYGHNPIFWFCYTHAWTVAPQAPTLDPLAYGHSRWGTRNPVESGGADIDNAGAGAYCHTTFANKPWMAPVSVGDERPNQNKFNERRNTEQLRTSWLAAINAGTQVEWVQVPTWDDFAEGAMIGPTQESGFFWLDVSAYYLVRYKTGSWPTILRDAIYLSHRKQFVSGATITGGQTQTAVIAGATAAVDQVEALVFTTVPTGTVVMTVGGASTSFNVAAMTAVSPGLFSCTVPLALGAVSATFTRNSTQIAAVTSPTAVVGSVVSQDMSYYGCTSLTGHI